MFIPHDWQAKEAERVYKARGITFPFTVDVIRYNRGTVSLDTMTVHTAESAERIAYVHGFFYDIETYDRAVIAVPSDEIKMDVLTKLVELKQKNPA